MINVGIDWAEDTHQVCILDHDGSTLEEFGIRDGVAGVSRLHERIAGHIDEPEQVVIGIETDRGLLVGALVAAGYQVYAVNPMSVDRYRDRHATSGSKSDRGDAKVTVKENVARAGVPTQMKCSFAPRMASSALFVNRRGERLTAARAPR